MGNSKLMTKIRSAARRAGYLTQAEDAFGKKILAYNGIPLVDLDQFYNGTATVPTVQIVDTRKPGGSTIVTGLTDLFAASFGLDGFHGVSPAGAKIINTYLPDMNQPGAVKKVEVEMVAAVVLKNSRKAGVFRNIKVR